MATSKPVRLILASGSPARRELLERAGHAFEVQPANVDEPSGAGVTDPRGYVQQVAWMKAAAVAPSVADGLVLAADTVGWHMGEVIGKPADAADARRILRTLGGTIHELWTGVILWRRPDDRQIAWQEVSRVAFKRLTDDELNAYLATRTWQGCSGAYAIQEQDDPYVRLVSGSISNVIGLPMESLAKALAWLRQPA
ncbi:MAG: septum formation protein Maf [Planctomycetes bacterium]|nr:septum formation protein Maf [Planctomycetota bacterium]